MEFRAPLYDDYNYYMINETEINDALTNDLELKNAKIARIKERMENRALQIDRIEISNWLVGEPMQVLNAAIEERETKIISELMNEIKLDFETYKMKKRTARIRRMIELTADRKGMEYRFGYMIHMEFRKLHFLMMDYLKYFSNQVEVYTNAGLPLPLSIAIEFDKNRVYFRQLKQHFEKKYHSICLFFDNRRHGSDPMNHIDEEELFLD